MSIETEENNNSNSLTEACKMPNDTEQSSNLHNEISAANNQKMASIEITKAANNGDSAALKERCLSSSDSGEGTAEQLPSETNSDGNGTRDSNRTTSGCLSNDEPHKTESDESDEKTEEVHEATTDTLVPLGDQIVNEDVAALLRGPAAVERPPSPGSDTRSRTLSWVRSCNGEAQTFSSHLDVKEYYRELKGNEAVDEVLRKMQSCDRYKRRANYDPDKPAAGTPDDAEYKFYLDKVCVKKLIGSHGENSEMIRAMNEVDFYISKDQSGVALEEIVTVRGSWSNVVQTVIDIRNMMHHVGKDINIDHINTAVDPQEFCLQNCYNNFVHIRLNVAEPIAVTGGMGISVIMQNLDDPRHKNLAKMDDEINMVYRQLPGWQEIVSEPPEQVPLPINDYSVVVAPDSEGRYYRAIVEGSCLESGQVHVWFLDWGGRVTLPITSLFKLHRYFTSLPYMALTGVLAGCQLREGYDSDTFGRFLFDFVNRYAPLKATAVNFDTHNGCYYILLHGNGGECLNHLLIDNGFVDSIPYPILQPLMDDPTTYPMMYYNKKTKTREKLVVPVYQPDYQAFVPDERTQYPSRDQQYYRRNYRPNNRPNRRPWNNQNGRNRGRYPGQNESRPAKNQDAESTLVSNVADSGNSYADLEASRVPSRGENATSGAKVSETSHPKATSANKVDSISSTPSSRVKTSKLSEASKGAVASEDCVRQKTFLSNATTPRKTVAAVVADTLCASAPAQNTNNFCSGRSSSLKSVDPKQNVKPSCSGISVRTVPNSNTSDSKTPQVTSSPSKSDSATSSSPESGSGSDSWILVDSQKKRKNRRNKKR